MFGKKNYTVEPIAVNEDVLIQLSSPVEISKKTKISVPNQYKAIAFIDQKPQFRIQDLPMASGRNSTYTPRRERNARKHSPR